MEECEADVLTSITIGETSQNDGGTLRNSIEEKLTYNVLNITYLTLKII